ncbi:MAG: hypothetical protein QOJ36_919 [Verrucomicrobiota bacterium]
MFPVDNGQFGAIGEVISQKSVANFVRRTEARFQ